MRGINQQKANENQQRYREIYAAYMTKEKTLKDLGTEHGITRQRIWQIITRCKLADGDYYEGMRIARQKWLELQSSEANENALREAFAKWLESTGVRLIKNNQSIAPHTGWENAKRIEPVEIGAGPSAEDSLAEDRDREYSAGGS